MTGKKTHRFACVPRIPNFRTVLLNNHFRSLVLNVFCKEGGSK
jgi:hypothetical protein